VRLRRDAIRDRMKGLLQYRARTTSLCLVKEKAERTWFAISDKEKRKGK
jgi:hypothetical protein